MIETKRKPDGSEGRWTDEDEENNKRLLQAVVPRPGEDLVTPEGIYILRLRFGCCVGGMKQLHVNHKKERSAV